MLFWFDDSFIKDYELKIFKAYCDLHTLKIECFLIIWTVFCLLHLFFFYATPHFSCSFTQSLPRFVLVLIRFCLPHTLTLYWLILLISSVGLHWRNAIRFPISGPPLWFQTDAHGFNTPPPPPNVFTSIHFVWHLWSAQGCYDTSFPVARVRPLLVHSWPCFERSAKLPVVLPEQIHDGAQMWEAHILLLASCAKNLIFMCVCVCICVLVWPCACLWIKCVFTHCWPHSVQVNSYAFWGLVNIVNKLDTGYVIWYIDVLYYASFLIKSIKNHTWVGLIHQKIEWKLLFVRFWIAPYCKILTYTHSPHIIRYSLPNGLDPL